MCCGRAHESASGSTLWVHLRPVADASLQTAEILARWPKCGLSLATRGHSELCRRRHPCYAAVLFKLALPLLASAGGGSGRAKVGTRLTTTVWHPHGRWRVCVHVWDCLGAFWSSLGWTRGVCVCVCGLRSPSPRPPVSCACRALHERRWRPRVGGQGAAAADQCTCPLFLECLAALKWWKTRSLAELTL